MTKSFTHWDADYTPNDMGPPDKLHHGRSEDEILKEEDIKNDLL